MRKMIQIVLPILLFGLLLSSCKSELSDEDLNQRYIEGLKSSDYQKSRDALNELIARYPEDAYTYFARATLYANLQIEGAMDSMLQDLNISLDLDSTNHHAIYWRFATLMTKGYFESASSDLERLIQMKGEKPFLLSWRGNCAFANKDFEEALGAYQKRMQYPGSQEELKSNYYYLIFSSYFNGDVEAAVQDCASMESRGFEADTMLLSILENEQLVWEDLAQFTLPQISLDQLDDILHTEIEKIDLSE